MGRRSRPGVDVCGDLPTIAFAIGQALSLRILAGDNIVEALLAERCSLAARVPRHLAGPAWVLFADRGRCAWSPCE